MPKKKVAIIQVGKALAKVSLTALAAVGGASGNLLFAGLSVLPLSVLDAYDALIKDESPKTYEEEQLELLAPTWWDSDARSWENVCTEIGDCLPKILRLLRVRLELEKKRDVIIRSKVQQAFIDLLIAQHLTWVTDKDKGKLAEYVAPLLLEKMEGIIEPIIERIRRETFYLEIHEVSQNTQETANAAGESARWLEKIYDELCAKAKEEAENVDKEHKSSSPTSSVLVTVLEEALASLSPEKLLKSEAAFMNQRIGRQLLEDISELIKRFEEYFDEIISLLVEAGTASNRRGRGFVDDGFLHLQAGDDTVPSVSQHRILVANRKLITISNEMRSIYHNLDKRFSLTSSTKDLINHVTSICAQITYIEGALVIRLVSNADTLLFNPKMQAQLMDVAYFFSHTYDNFRDDPFAVGDLMNDYHLALIELNNYKILLKETIEGFEQSYRQSQHRQSEPHSRDGD